MFNFFKNSSDNDSLLDKLWVGFDFFCLVLFLSVLYSPSDEEELLELEEEEDLLFLEELVVSTIPGLNPAVP